MEDIRRYFKARQAPKPSNSERKCVESSKSGTRKCAKISGKESLKKRPSLVIESDSDEDPLPPKKHKTKATVIDDSDEDIKAPTSIKLSQQKVISPTRKQRETVLKKVKPITASSYFGTAPVHRSSKTLPKQETKTQIAKDDFEIHDDDDFRETLKLLDSSNVFTQLENKAPSHNTNGNGTEQKDKPGKTAFLKEEKPATQKFQTPAKKPEANKEEPAIVKTPSSSTEKKPNYYMHYLHRGGPKAPGSKEIPQGADGCLEKLTFVITGVLDSLDRDEAAELIKKYGGKVTQSVSKNTSYMIVGQDAGPSKLEKADKFGIKQLDEDGLLELIGKSACKSSVSKSPTPVKSSSTKDQPRFEKLQLTATITNATKSKHVTVHQDEKKHVTAGSHESDLSKEEDVKDKSPLSVKKSDTVANLMWVDKYRPLTTKQIIGQQGDRSNVQKLRHWLENWRRNHGSSNKQKKQGFGKWGADDGSNFKAALLSGPPGVGKTTTAQLVCKELKFTYVELNASDTRSKKHLQNDVSRMLQNKSLAASMDGGPNVDEKHCLLMDEVDGMAGNEDRGGVQELIQLIKKSKIPIICMCNDRMHPKIRSLANYCFDLRFQRPRIEQLKSAMMSVCFKESINVPPQALHEIIIGANQDVRQIINHLSLWSIKNKTLSIDEASTEAKHAKKDVKMGPFDVLKIVFSASDHKTMSIHEKSNLFFHDYSIAPLFVQENYLSVNPQKAVKNSTAHLRLVSKAADSICDGDLVEKLIRSQGHWGLLPVEAMFASVIPGDTMEGYLNQMIAFPSWLGRNSTKGKNDRFLQELHMHMKLKTSGNKTDVNLDYLHCLADAIVSPLTMRQNDGISDAVATMCEYNLMREDLDSLLDLRLWPNQENQFAKLSPQVKASFTRSFNKTSQPLSYATAITVKKSDNSVGISIDGEYNDLDEDESDVESEDISKDAMIKKKVPPKRKATDTGQPSTSKKTKAPKKGGKKSKS